MTILRWLAGEAYEKVNLAATWRELKELGHKHGRRFFIVAVLWEMVEDLVFPVIAIFFKHPWLVPVFLVLHFEPVVYPMFFYGFRTWDRLQGREPWEPDRLAMSAYWRTGLKVLSHRLLSLGLFLLWLRSFDLGFGILAAYTVVMTVFAFIHDRIWHDSNFGIDVPSDTVSPLRILVKASTYRVVSVIVMCSVFRAILGYVPIDVLFYQLSTFTLGLLLSQWWARNDLGLSPVVKT